MKQAALGFRVHSGWTALVAVAVEDGAPCVLARARPHLIEAFTYQFRQPYHTAAGLPFDKASEFISRVRKESRDLAYRAIHEIQADMQKQGFKLSQAALLLASGKQLPALDKVLASHALIHTADGELFREALLHASARCRLATICVKERELLDQAAESLRLRPDVLLRRVTNLGRPFGSPWSQDEKFATIIAWLSLASPSNRNGA
ncbi:MAG: hypothetical protein WBQ76_05620 [Candidatus Korobacteraceae bacterium]